LATPHGTGSYVRIPLRSDLPAGHIRAFDTEVDYTDTQAKVRIEQVIRFEHGKWSQIARCKLVKPPIDERDTSFYSPLAEVTEAAADWLVIKAYDYAYYPGSFGAPWENNEEADGRFSREHSAYEYYQSNHRSGYPESMPKFYGGCWQGRAGPTKLVIKKMLHAIAIGLHMGVNHRGCDPWNVFITMQTNNKDLQEIRVVFLDHADTELLRLVAPPFYPADEEENRKAEELRVKEFDEWLLSPDVFGPLEEAKDEWDRLQAEGKPWPHPYAKYSITDTLHNMQEEMRARAREKKQKSQEGEEGGLTPDASFNPAAPPFTPAGIFDPNTLGNITNVLAPRRGNNNNSHDDNNINSRNTGADKYNRGRALTPKAVPHAEVTAGDDCWR
ncbi:hypothetical protein CSOJ01_07894, partial [Colletotrichum sojae]